MNQNFDFDLFPNLNLLVLTIFMVLQIKPGLSAYAQDPRQAAESLISLLDKAESVVPMEYRPMTPVRVGVCIVYIHFYLYIFYSSELYVS